MEPQQEPGEIYRARKSRRKHHHSGPRRRALAITGGVVLIAGMAWLYYRSSNANPLAITPPAKSAERLALIAAVNKIVAQAGKEVPRPSVVVDNAGLHDRDGHVYLSGTLLNQSSQSYARVHVMFETLDINHNPAGLVEGDVTGLLPEKTTSFEFGPVNPDIRSFSIRSIEPVQ